MKKDIVIPEVKNVHVAVIKEQNEEGEQVWNVYLINKLEKTIGNVLVASSGYKTDEKGNKQSSSVLRHFLEDVTAQSAKKIEPIIEDVFHLNNEYFVTYFTEEGLHEKQFVFVSESILESNFTEIPYLGKKGVMI